MARLRRRLEREKRARLEAERLLTDKARELYASNDALRDSAESLRKHLDFRALELINAQRLARLGTLVWDIRKNEVTWSEGVYHILGLDPNGAQLSVQRYLALIHPADREEVSRYIKDSANDIFELHQKYQVEHRVVTPAGDVRWVQGYAEAISYQNAEIEYVIAAIRDVTSDKRAERQAEESRRIIEQRVREMEQVRDDLARARDAAQSANQTKSRFLAMMSHEIRTPMNGILGTLSMLGESDLNVAQKKLLGMARASGESLRSILNDILDMSKMEAGRLELECEKFPLPALIEEACAFWRPLAEDKGLSFRMELEPGLPPDVRGDPARIRQILNNLLSNALKFTRHGSIMVRVSRLGGEALPSSEQAEIVFEVQDTGIGIARDQQALLFREFSQLGDGNVSGQAGTGLGLAISRQLAELMDGAVGVTSAPDCGSSFWLRLPLQIESTSVPAASREPLPPLSARFGRRPKVLLAEDVPTNQVIAEHFLLGFDCQVEIACNGLEVLTALAERPFDIVLMDVSMPEMDGIEASRSIRRRDDDLAHIPILGVTAYAMKEDQQRFLAAGMNGCIAKPLSRTELYRALDALLLSKPTSSAAAAADSGPVAVLVDQAVLDDLLNFLSADQVTALFERLDTDLRDCRTRASEALGEKDAEALARVAHATKGLASGIGAGPLAASASLIERASRAEPTALPVDRVREFCELVDQTLAHFSTLRAARRRGVDGGGSQT